MAEHDTSEPILVLVRRGRKNRGFSVSPVEDVSNAASCADEKEIGEVIVEMLDDPRQPRVNINELLAAAAGAPTTRTPDEDEDEDEDDDDDDYEDDDGGGSPIDEVLGGEGDLADKAIIWGLSSLLNKGRNMSSSKVTDTGSRKKKKKKKKKKKTT